MTTLDFVILVLLGGFTLFGLWFGVIHMIGSFVGLILGAYAAGHYYEAFGTWIAGLTGGNVNFWRLASVFIVYVLVNRLVGLLFWLLEKAFNFIAVIPFLKTFNRLLGAGLGLIEGTFVIGLGVWFAARFPFNVGFTDALQASSIARAVLGVGSVLAPLLPEAVRLLKSVI